MFVDSTGWSSSFTSYLATNNLGSSTLGYQLLTGANQLATLPWNNVNQISVQFNQSVTVDQASQYLELITSGNTAMPLSSASFSYADDVATWTLPSSYLTDDQYMLYIPSAAVTNSAGQQLDGEFINTSSSGVGSSLPSGDGVAGGDFAFNFHVLPGDANQDGDVTAATLAHQASVPPTPATRRSTTSTAVGRSTERMRQLSRTQSRTILRCRHRLHRCRAPLVLAPSPLIPPTIIGSWITAFPRGRLRHRPGSRWRSTRRRTAVCRRPTAK